jgi:hypothetical protein
MPFHTPSKHINRFVSMDGILIIAHPHPLRPGRPLSPLEALINPAPVHVACLHGCSFSTNPQSRIPRVNIVMLIESVRGALRGPGMQQLPRPCQVQQKMSYLHMTSNAILQACSQVPQLQIVHQISLRQKTKYFLKLLMYKILPHGQYISYIKYRSFEP